jgi:Ni/Co efflux regulator RcnB
MKKVLTLLVAALTAVSFASVAMADHHMKKEEAKPAGAAAPATPATPAAAAAEKKEVNKELKKKVVNKKAAVKGKKKRISGC